MTEVDPYDDSIVRYVIRRHQYDPETKHLDGSTKVHTTISGNTERGFRMPLTN